MKKVQKLILEQFTAFGQRTELEFSSGINVFIGANSTGKTHAMKAIYTMLKICEKARRDSDGKSNGISTKRLEVLAQDKFEGVFKPDTIGRLVRHGRGNRFGKIEIMYEGKSADVKITSQSNVYFSSEILPQPVPPRPTVSLPVTPPPPQQIAAVPPRALPAEQPKQPPQPQQQPPVTPQTKAPAAAKEKIFLQAGSFRKNDEAENMKARLAMLGVFASVQPIDLAEKGTWYRVRIGPFNSKADSDQTSASLRENGIDTQFVKLQ